MSLFIESDNIHNNNITKMDINEISNDDVLDDILDNVKHMKNIEEKITDLLITQDNGLSVIEDNIISPHQDIIQTNREVNKAYNKKHVNMVRMGGITTGAVIGSVFGPLGAGIGAGIGLLSTTIITHKTF